MQNDEKSFADETECNETTSQVICPPCRATSRGDGR